MDSKRKSQPGGATTRTQPATAATPETAPAPTRKRKQALTEKVYSLSHTPHLFFKVTGPLRTEHMPALSRNEDGNVQVLPIADLETGEVGLLLVLAVLASAMERAGEYVGKSFEVVAGEPREGKNYREVQVWEVE